MIRILWRLTRRWTTPLQKLNVGMRASCAHQASETEASVLVRGSPPRFSEWKDIPAKYDAASLPFARSCPGDPETTGVGLADRGVLTSMRKMRLRVRLNLLHNPPWNRSSSRDHRLAWAMRHKSALWRPRIWGGAGFARAGQFRESFLRRLLQLCFVNAHVWLRGCATK